MKHTVKTLNLLADRYAFMLRYFDSSELGALRESDEWRAALEQSESVLDMSWFDYIAQRWMERFGA